VPGIDLPDQPMHGLREKTLATAEQLTGTARLIVYGCEHGPDLGRFKSEQIGIVRLPCIAALPPSFLDFVITRRYAEGVFLTGCAEGDCHYRLGQQWQEQRMTGERDPYLRSRVPRERIEIYWAGLTRYKNLHRKLSAFHDRLEALSTLEQRVPRKRVIRPAATGSEHHD
ncbi:MAG: hydrogenase iron-sulfur subunit, partial [Gammaproteobacteria bacterium]|nr:hydrogenase iron-sulfur subunit [Gammaproteobacteria bacterium]